MAGRKHNATGRSVGGERHVRLPHWVLDCAAFRALNPLEVRVFIEACRIYNGSNNGMIALPVRDVGERCSMSKSAVARALTRLEDLGFLEAVKRGVFRRRDQKASEYRITLHDCDLSGHKATKRFMQYIAEYEARSPTGTERSPTGTARNKITTHGPSQGPSGQKQAAGRSPVGTHIIYQAGEAATPSEAKVVAFPRVSV